MYLRLPASPSSCLEQPRVTGPVANHKKKANRENPEMSASTLLSLSLNQFQHSLTSDLVMGEKQTRSLFKPPKSSFL